MESEKHNYLEFTIKALSLINMWPQRKQKHSIIRKYCIIAIIIVTTFPILADLISQFYEKTISITDINENLVALSALYGVIYISICFIQKNNEIKLLVDGLSEFEEYSPMSIIVETEKSTKFYTKFFIFYGIIGNICYGLTPFLNYYNCQKTKTVHMVKFGIPCGLVVRFLLPFKFDYSPLAEIVTLEEIVVCTLGTTIIMMVTMLVCGVLIHITSHLKHLKAEILGFSTLDNENLYRKIKFCIKFHTAILDYSSKADSSFSQMMLLHISWTGFIISVLGFEIVMTTSYVETMRFMMHLTGWLGMLFLVCYYGQTLMDESSGISDAIYSFAWYNKSVLVQKHVILILLRSQRALTLKACGMKVMSLATFLGVLYTAYSYFTLLLKLKS